MGESAPFSLGTGRNRFSSAGNLLEAEPRKAQSAPCGRVLLAPPNGRSCVFEKTFRRPKEWTGNTRGAIRLPAPPSPDHN